MSLGTGSLFGIFPHRQCPLLNPTRRPQNVYWGWGGHVGLHSSPVANFKATFLLNAKGLPKVKRRSQEIRNTHRKKEGALAGDKCQRKEPREPSGRPGRALAWPEKRGGERAEGAGPAGAEPSRKARGGAAKRPEEGSRGQRRSARWAGWRLPTIPPFF